MSVEIEGNKIKMTRGDTLLAEIQCFRKEGDELVPYTPENGDKVRFALKHATMNKNKTEFIEEEPLIRRDIPIDTMLLELYPEDTKELGFGRNYTYDIEITFADGRVSTFIEDSPFELTREVD